jgi:hypothetical protein
MGIGYVLAVDQTITEIRCSNEGLTPTQAFMSTQKVSIQTAGGPVQCNLVSFMDKGGKLSGFMRQGIAGIDVVATEDVDEEHLEMVKKALEC